ncbi:ParA family protein [Adlercreutzia sp. ZJ473]|uniref:nucleotide-binding protein n=1 Tax=Adlercreutzia sp. ZJ473 TaxID=2722822 RepID=UPI0015576C84|nr:ParA family protein [Adlercreutzia sp. ZJ473]
MGADACASACASACAAGAERAGGVPFALAPVNVVAGHYGVGKTNLAINLAIDAARAGHDVTLVDLDVVNPYFRSTEYRGVLEEAGVDVVAPVFAEAGSSLDVPSLTGAVVPAVERAYADAAFEDAGGAAEGRTRSRAQSLGQSCSHGSAAGASGSCGTRLVSTAPRPPLHPQVSAPCRGGGRARIDAAPSPRTVVIIDAGGDDAGAMALGRFARHVAAGPYALIYVVNRFRNLTQEPDEALEVLAEIERAARLRATGAVSNAHLKADTTGEVVARGAAFAQAVADAAGLPLLCVTAPKTLTQPESDELSSLRGAFNLYPVELRVKTPWE